MIAVRLCFSLPFVVAPFVPFACSSDADPSRAAGDAGRASSDGAASGEGAAAEEAAAADATSADAAARGKLFAFVGSDDGKIRVYAVTSGGAWTFLKASSAGQTPSFLAFDPARRRVVAVDEAAPSGLVRSFDFDPATGALAEKNSRTTGGAGTTYVSLDPTGRWVFAANYTAGTMAVLPIDASGALGAATDTKPSGAMSHWAGTNPSGTHVFVPALGANTVAEYALDAQTGTLADVGTASPPAGSGPRHLAFHPAERWAYLVNETAITVTTFAFDKTAGKLTPLQTVSALPPGQSAAGVSGAEIVVHPSGKHVYASTRVYDSIAHFRVAADGTLSRVANAGTGGHRPRSFAIDPEGTLLFAGNQDVDQVVGFAVDAASGALTPLGKTVDVPRPTFVGLARMP